MSRKKCTSAKKTKLALPTYSLDGMKLLVNQRKFRLALGPLNDLKDIYGPEANIKVPEIFSAIKGKDFFKTLELDNRPGKMADVYKGVRYDGQRWYIKAFLEDDLLEVQIWSMKPDEDEKKGTKHV